LAQRQLFTRNFLENNGHFLVEGDPVLGVYKLKFKKRYLYTERRRRHYDQIRSALTYLIGVRFQLNLNPTQCSTDVSTCP
jgi:hypothetical protein